MRDLTTAEFKEEIYDFDNGSEFKLKGDLPVIVDYSAKWCGPCRMITPMLDELQEEFKDKIKIVKVDIDNEHEVAIAFGIRSIPSLLFAPIDGEPEMIIGAQSKAQYIDHINELLFNKKTEE